MKRLFTLLTIALFFSATIQSCGPKKEEAKEADKQDEAASDYEAKEEAKPDAQDKTELIAQGQTLVAASDCATCHHATNKLIGPSHTDVAKKYEFNQANISMLSDKIISGGSGNWGDIPMAAHPDLSKADAEKMATYVLSLDGEKYK